MSEPDYYAQQLEQERQLRDDREEMFERYMANLAELAQALLCSMTQKHGLPSADSEQELCRRALSLADTFNNELHMKAAEISKAFFPLNANPPGGQSPEVYDSVERDHDRR